MNAIQLEFTLHESEPEKKENDPFSSMQAKIDEAIESMGKVRKKLFAKMTEIEKMCLELKDENTLLKSLLGEEYVSVSTNEEESIKIDA